MITFTRQPAGSAHPHSRAVRSKVTLLFTRDNCALFHPLSLNILREVCLYFGQQLLVAVTQRILRVYDLELRQVCTTSIDVSFSFQTVVCLIDWRTALCLGDEETQPSKVWRLDLLLSTLSPTASMQVGRMCPGVIVFRRCVYVFGGKRHVFLKSCEKYNIETSAWSRLPDMHKAKVGFSPCEYQGQIVLAEVHAAGGSLEVFNPLSETFEEYPFAVPSILNGSVSFVVGTDLVMISISRKMVSWDLGHLSTKPIVRSFPLVTADDAMSSTPPVQVGETVFWTNYVSGEVVAFSLRTCTLVPAITKFCPGV